MGFKKMFGMKPPAEMTDDQTRHTLETNGAYIPDSSEMYNRKFKFGEFDKYTKEKSKDVQPLKPVGLKGPDDGYDGAASQGTYSAASEHTYQSGSSAGGNYGSGRSQQMQQGQEPDQQGQGQQVQQQQLPPDHLQQQQEEEHYDPYADTQTVETDFNNYPGASRNSAQTELQYQPYKPELEQLQEQHQLQEQEMDSEEEEINRIVRQTKDVREATVQSSGNIVKNLREADQTATNTMGALGSQREKMFKMERTVNNMDTQQRFVDEHVKDLEHYNRSLFHIKTSNPFTRKSRKKAAEQKFLAQRQSDRERDAQLNGTLYNSQRAIIAQMKDQPDDSTYNNEQSELQQQADYDERVQAAQRYLTQDHDEEDERMEVEYSRNMDEAQQLATGLKSKAQAISEEIGSQNKDLAELSEKVNKVDDKTVLQTNRIRGI